MPPDIGPAQRQPLAPVRDDVEIVCVPSQEVGCRQERAQHGRCAVCNGCVAEYSPQVGVLGMVGVAREELPWDIVIQESSFFFLRMKILYS